MNNNSKKIRKPHYLPLLTGMPQFVAAALVSYDWRALRTQLLEQWGDLTAMELDSTGADRHKIALLVECKYGIASKMVENYLRNFERTLPLAANSNMLYTAHAGENIQSLYR